MKKTKRVLACFLAFSAIFSCLTFSGCLSTILFRACQEVTENGIKIQRERQQRLDAIESEMDSPLILVGDTSVIVLDENGNKTEKYFQDAAERLKKSDLNNSSEGCFYATDEKAYCRYLYHQYETREQYTDANGFLQNRSTFTYDMILFSYEYATDAAELLYVFEKIPTVVNRCAFIDDTHILLNDTDGKKILDLTTKTVIATTDETIETKTEEAFYGISVDAPFDSSYDYKLFEFGDEKYYRRSGTVEFFTETGELALTFDETFMREKSAAYGKLCTYYNVNKEYPPEAQHFLKVQDRFFIVCFASYPGWVSHVDSDPFVFEYNFKNGQLQYVGYTSSSAIVRILLP